MMTEAIVSNTKAQPVNAVKALNFFSTVGELEY